MCCGWRLTRGAGSEESVTAVICTTEKSEACLDPATATCFTMNHQPPLWLTFRLMSDFTLHRHRGEQKNEVVST